MLYDLIIIGGGPGGAAAAIYAARKQLRTLLVTSDFGGQSIVSEDIQNWIGTPTITGADLAKNLKNHVLTYAGAIVEIQEEQKVISVEKIEGGFSIKTDGDNTYTTKTILSCAGSSRRKLTVPGAERLEHKGLTYCASCDGPMFSNMDVAVIGGGNAGIETVAQLLAYTKSVTLINRSETFRADEITVKKVLSNPKITVIKNADIAEITGEKFVEGIKIKDKKTGEEKIVKVAGIFVEIGQIPNTNFIKNLVDLDEYGRVKIDPWTQSSSTVGIWAAGDCTNALYHQNNIAVGDAIKAAENIYLYLHTK